MCPLRNPFRFYYFPITKEDTSGVRAHRDTCINHSNRWLHIHALQITPDDIGEVIARMENRGNPLLLKSLIGKMARIGNKDPESRYGKILSVKSDYLILETEEEGVIYYKLRHIKSVTVDGKDFSDLSFNPETAAVTAIQAESFADVMEGMKGRWVQMNRSGPECLQGVLTDRYEDHVLLIINSDVVRVFTYHIKNISFVNSAGSTSEAVPTQQAADATSDSRTSKDQETRSGQAEPAANPDSMWNGYGNKEKKTRNRNVKRSRSKQKENHAKVKGQVKQSTFQRKTKGKKWRRVILVSSSWCPSKRSKGILFRKKVGKQSNPNVWLSAKVVVNCR
jgi:spore coat protein B